MDEPRTPGWVTLRDGSSHELATPGSRLGARLIDALIVGGVFALLLLVLGVGGFYVIGVVTTAGWIVYEGAFISARGQTLGKMCVRIIVVSHENGGIPPLANSFGRPAIPGVLSLVPGIGGLVGLIGHLALLWDRDRRSWYDKAAGTVVLKAYR